MTKQEAKEQGKCNSCNHCNKKTGECTSKLHKDGRCTKWVIEENMKKARARYKVEPCVSDYAVKDAVRNELVTICNSKRNADLIAAILEKDSHCGDGWGEVGSSYTFTDDDYYKVASQYSTRMVYGIEEVRENGKPCRNFVPGVIVRHFKGNLYEITDIVRHTETDEPMVVYRALYDTEANPYYPWGRQTFTRPLAMFSEEVDRQKYPYAGQQYRMEIVRFKDVRVWTPNAPGAMEGNV